MGMPPRRASPREESCGGPDRWSDEFRRRGRTGQTIAYRKAPRRYRSGLLLEALDRRPSSSPDGQFCKNEQRGRPNRSDSHRRVARLPSAGCVAPPLLVRGAGIPYLSPGDDMSRWIKDWNPEDADFWEKSGKSITRRNLVWSILAENLGFSVWLVWSIAATKLASVGFRYTTAQLFTLVSLPGLIGSFMRFPYTFAVPRFGGRNWTVVSALLLLIPAVSLVVLVRHPETPFWLMALAASTAGLGGGNFASSMANISFFYPDRKKGFALGLNAAGGNIGVSTVQLLVPIVIGIGAANGSPRLENAGLMWLPLIVVSAIGAFLFMDNLSSARSNFGDQLVIARRQQTWVMSFLYIGTFGSFVAFSAAFPLLLKSQ